MISLNLPKIGKIDLESIFGENSVIVNEAMNDLIEDFDG